MGRPDADRSLVVATPEQEITGARKVPVLVFWCLRKSVVYFIAGYDPRVVYSFELEVSTVPTDPRRLFALWGLLLASPGGFLFCQTPVPGSTILFSNFGPGYSSISSYGNYVGGQTPGFPAGVIAQVVAMPFSPSGNARFADAILPLGILPGAYSGQPYPAQLYLTTDVNGLPGTTLEEINVNVSGPWNTTLTTFTSALNPSLSAGTKYWIIASATLPTTDQLYWNANSTNDDAFPGTLCEECSIAGPWLTPTISYDQPKLAFEIDGLPACPMSVSLSFGFGSLALSQQYMAATAFPPMNATLLEYAQTCGFDGGFNWQQLITHELPHPNGGGVVPLMPAPLISSGNVAYYGSPISLQPGGPCLAYLA